MSVQPVISVVVSTYNRASVLRGAVESLLQLADTSPPHEVIIVDNNSKDETRAVVESLIPASDGRLRYVFEGRQGVSHGRNAGVAAARAPLIAITDDDLRVSPHWLSTMVETFAAHPEVDYIGGRIVPLWPVEPPSWLDMDHSAPLALMDYGSVGFQLTPLPFRCAVCANMGVRRAAFEEFGGFDPDFDYQPGAATASEDHEFQMRLLQAGRRGWYEPAALVYAAITRERLTKRYHRRWHLSRGRAMARMTPPGHDFDWGATTRPLPADARQLLGVPLFMYRGLLRDSWAAAVQRVHRNPRHLWTEMQVLEQWGAVSYLLGMRRTGRDADVHETPPPPIEWRDGALEADVA